MSAAMIDRKLYRWSTALLLLAVLTAVANVIAPLISILQNQPIIFAKGEEIWKTTLSALPVTIACAFVVMALMPQIAWLSVVFHIMQLARNFRNGEVFAVENVKYFSRIGISLCIMAVLESIAYPAINFLFYYTKISPWLADMPWLSFLEPDLLMAGAFFLILGKIMTRGVELQTAEQLTI